MNFQIIPQMLNYIPDKKKTIDGDRTDGHAIGQAGALFTTILNEGIINANIIIDFNRTIPSSSETA